MHPTISPGLQVSCVMPPPFPPGSLLAWSSTSQPHPFGAQIRNESHMRAHLHTTYLVTIIQNTDTAPANTDNLLRWQINISRIKSDRVCTFPPALSKRHGVVLALRRRLEGGFFFLANSGTVPSASDASCCEAFSAVRSPLPSVVNSPMSCECAVWARPPTGL